MTEEIKTDNSALILHDLPEEMCKLIPCIIDVIKDLLIINPKIKIFGKDAMQRRSVGFFSNESIGYKYSGKTMPAIKLTDDLMMLLYYVNSTFGSIFNGILVNYYLDGNEYIGRHSDNERGINKEVGVISISYGAVRKFRIRDKITNKIIKDIPTNPGKIIQMMGDFQREFTHEIPIEKKVKLGRYSFTFRYHTV
mgnify:CR=1 FL=1